MNAIPIDIDTLNSLTRLYIPGLLSFKKKDETVETPGLDRIFLQVGPSPAERASARFLFKACKYTVFAFLRSS